MKDLKYRVKRLQKRAKHYKESDPSGKELRSFCKDYLAVRRAIEKLSADLAHAYNIYEYTTNAGSLSNRKSNNQKQMTIIEEHKWK